MSSDADCGCLAIDTVAWIRMAIGRESTVAHDVDVDVWWAK